jgi:RNA polymerase sigma-54 factor
MKQSLQLRIGQSLTMTPQLQQAIRLLQLSSIELQSEIQQTVDENPLLEQDDALSEVNLLDRETIKNSETDSPNEDQIEIKTSADNIADNRAEQVLPDELDVDAHWDEIYDTAPTTSQVNQDDNRDMF